MMLGVFAGLAAVAALVFREMLVDGSEGTQSSPLASQAGTPLDLRSECNNFSSLCSSLPPES